MKKQQQNLRNYCHDYAKGFTRGEGAPIFSSLVGIVGVSVDRKNLRKGKQTNWRDIAPDAEVEEVETNKKLSEEYAAKSAKCEQLFEEFLEHINQLKKADGLSVEG